MAEGLDVQVALDARLIQSNPTQVVETGAAQNLQRSIPATSVSGTQLLWQNLVSIGPNVLIDSALVVEYDVAVSWVYANDGNKPQLPGIDCTDANTPVILTNFYDPAAGATATQTPNVVFAQYPLTRVTNSIGLAINNVQNTVLLSQLLNNTREWILDADKKHELASSCPTFGFVSPNNIMQAAGKVYPNQPSTPYWASAGYSNASFFPISLKESATAGTWVAIYRLREPVFCSPLSQSVSAALANVQTLNLQYNLDLGKQLQGMFSSKLAFDTATLSATITAANLIIDYLTVDTLKTGRLPEVAYYNYDFPEFMQTQLVGLPTAPQATNGSVGVSYTVNTNSQKLTTMPKYYCVKLGPNFQGVSSQNTLCGFPIQEMTITFGSAGNYRFTREQLWQCFKKNTGRLDISFPQWVAIGTPVILNPAVDITSSADMFQGKVGDSGILFTNTITYTLENYISALGNIGAGTNPISGLGVDTNNCYAYECWMQVGSVQIGGGTCIFKNTTVDEREFVAAMSKDMVSSQALQNSQGMEGGSFFSKLKGVIHGARQAAGLAASVLKHPMAQKGLEYLASGAGVSGGALTHSLRRRK